MDWRAKIVSQFVQDAGTKVWAVSDPDSLVRNEQVMGQLQGKGFECVFFEDPIAFRYEYESHIRRAWERGNELPVIILFDDRIDGFNALPSDVLESAARMEFGLSTIFPNCDAGVIREIPTKLWDKLSDHLSRARGKTFNKRDTEELVLRVCYKLSPELIDSTPEFYRKLFDLHLNHDGLPEKLASRFGADLSRNKEFADLNIQRLCLDKHQFWAFIAQQWNTFLKGEAKLAASSDSPSLVIPFGSPLLRGYIGTFIDKGQLKRLDAKDATIPEDAWWRIGLKVKSHEAAGINEGDLKALRSFLPEDGANSRDWIDFAVRYSELTSKLFRATNQTAVEYFWNSFWPEIDSRFFQWLEDYYSGLHNLPASPPVMQHHIPKQLNRLRSKGHRVALILLDGMSLAGWKTVYETLSDQLAAEYQMHTSGVFSWLPSLTPICRQATFSGLAPRLFENTISRTDRDGARWKEFWEANAELRPSQITHLQHKGDASEALLDEAVLDQTIAFGLTVEKPDKIMHGSSLGWPGWHQQIKLWTENGYLAQLIDQLLSNGYTVCITADHGNLEACGTGKISEGVLAESRGQRTRVYANESLRASTLEENPEATACLEIPILPEDRHALYAKGRGAFVTKGEVIVTHGGASIDEMIVPWVTIEGNKK